MILDKSWTHLEIRCIKEFFLSCARTLMVNDMVKAKDQLINILCSLEKIYPLAFFDIMIHLVMHLSEEALEGGPVSFWWMYPFERYMKKLKNYVQNKAKPEGSKAEGYVADEVLTFYSRYFRGVGMKFNYGKSINFLLSTHTTEATYDDQGAFKSTILSLKKILTVKTNYGKN